MQNSYFKFFYNYFWLIIILPCFILKKYIIFARLYILKVKTMFKSAAYRYINGSIEEAVLESDINMQELLAVTDNVELADKNISSFVSGGPCLNMLLWGEKGSGKSTLLRLLALKYAPQGLVTIEFIDETPGAIYNLYKIIREHSDKKFLLFFDDISFKDDDVSYRRFKSAIEGGIESKPKNVIYAATSNRRHMVSASSQDTGDIYDRDEASEQTSLQARFGLSIGFYPLNKNDYLNIVKMYLNKYNIDIVDGWEKMAESYAIDRGGRSGRLAKQFAAYLYLTQK